MHHLELDRETVDRLNRVVIRMAEYWLVSAPGDPTLKETWEKIRDKTGTLSLVNKFSLPDLKV